MNKADVHHQRIARMSFASVYPMYVEKVEKKGRTKAELHTVIEWLTGFDGRKHAHLITGVICGYRIEEIEIRRPWVMTMRCTCDGRAPMARRTPISPVRWPTA